MARVPYLYRPKWLRLKSRYFRDYRILTHGQLQPTATHRFEKATSQLMLSARFYANHLWAIVVKPRGTIPLVEGDWMNHQLPQEVMVQSFEHYTNDSPIHHDRDDRIVVNGFQGVN